MGLNILSLIPRRGLWCFAVVGLIACGSEDEQGFESAFPGVYQITSWTVAEGDCEAAGESRFEEKTQEDSLVLIDDCSYSLPGIPNQRWLDITACSDESDCESERCQKNSLPSPSGEFGVLMHGSDAAGWTLDPPGYGAFSSRDGLEGSCGVRVYIPNLHQDETGVLTFEKRTLERAYEVIDGTCMSEPGDNGDREDIFDPTILEGLAEEVRETGTCVERVVVSFEALDSGD